MLFDQKVHLVYDYEPLKYEGKLPLSNNSSQTVEIYCRGSIQSEKLEGFFFSFWRDLFSFQRLQHILHTQVLCSSRKTLLGFLN